MASRKDNKGRVLQTGEYQHKDGRYSFSYSDAAGTRHVFYATTLQELRVKEKNRLMVRRHMPVFEMYPLWIR